MILLIDNYDSFSYNLYQAVGQIRADVSVVRNDVLTVSEVEQLSPDAIILSPGPGRPEDAGICMELVEKLTGKVPILGVCLGHQSISKALGGVVSYAGRLMHGKTSMAEVDTDSQIFRKLETPIQVGRYHSLEVVKEKLPDCLRITAQTNEGEIMAVEHSKYPVYGLQFHPESILTPDGLQIIKNFLEVVKYD